MLLSTRGVIQSGGAHMLPWRSRGSPITVEFIALPRARSMNILEYVGLDTTRVKAQYEKVRRAIERDDFRQADVKKLANVTHGRFYRARLDYANRLLFSIVRHGGTTYALSSR